MPAKPLTVTLPEPLLERIRGRARRSKRTVEAEVVQILSEAVAAGGNGSANGAVGKRSRSGHGKNRGPEEDALPPDIEEAMARVELLDERALRKAVKPLMTKKQADRLAELNRQAKNEGLSDEEEAERDRLLHVYNKSVLVRGAALAELKKRGVDVSDLTAL
jgi:hypothetical protein